MKVILCDRCKVDVRGTCVRIAAPAVLRDDGSAEARPVHDFCNRCAELVGRRWREAMEPPPEEVR